METWEKHDLVLAPAIGPELPPSPDVFYAVPRETLPPLDPHTILIIEEVMRAEAARAREDAKPPAVVEEPVVARASPERTTAAKTRPKPGAAHRPGKNRRQKAAVADRRR
jgi:hypothetical protein